MEKLFDVNAGIAITSAKPNNVLQGESPIPDHKPDKSRSNKVFDVNSGGSKEMSGGKQAPSERMVGEK